MLAEQHTLKMSFFHKFSFTINGMETLYFNSFCKRFTVRKCLHIHFGFIYAFSLFPVPYQKVTALFRRNIKFSELCHGVITHLQRWKAPRAKKKNHYKCGLNSSKEQRVWQDTLLFKAATHFTGTVHKRT